MHPDPQFCKMRPDTRLDYAVFQLTPNRTRCELHIVGQGMTYKLAAGLLKPFVAHLSVAEEQIARGSYTIRLEPPDPGSATWFTKGTMERFVRFVSTPEVLERVGAVEMELMDIEETIRAQAADASEEIKTATDQFLKLALSSASTGGLPTSDGSMEQPSKDSLDGAEMGMEEARKQQLLRYLDARQTMLQKEQEAAFVRAMAAGFNIEQIEDLMLFAETFGALCLREACRNYTVAYKKRQDCRVRQDDVSVAAVGSAQAEMAFKNSSRGPLALQDGSAKRDELSRRASLPGDWRLAMGDSGLERLTRRGSLDELTGEFWQVAARMRAAGTIDAATADWASNWQLPKGGRNLPTMEGAHVGAGYLGSNSEIQIPEAGAGPVRGHHAIMPAWHHGHPENHFMHNIHPLPLHPSLPPPLDMSRPGLPYSPYHGNPYITQAYAEANSWQMPPSHPPAYWSGHHGYNGNVAPSASERGDRNLQTQNQGALDHTALKDEANEERRASAQQPATDQVDSKYREETVSALPMQRPASDMLVCEGKGETVNSASMQIPACDVPVNKDTYETIHIPMLKPTDDLLVSQKDGKGETVNSASMQIPACDNLACKDTYETVHTPMLKPTNDPLISQKDGKGETVNSACMQIPACDRLVSKDTYETVHTPVVKPTNDSVVSQKDGEHHMEMTRRMPIRSSSPSRRSASPLRKVQIARSGPKKPGIVRRSVSCSTQNSQDQGERETNDRESSGSWSEDNEDAKNDKRAQPEPVRARVQDVIGLFESKKDSDGLNVKPLKKQTRRLPSENSLVSKWESGALRREANDAEELGARNQSRRVAPGSLAQSVAETKSKQTKVMREKDEQRAATAEEDTILDNESQGASSRPKDGHSSATLDAQGQDEDSMIVSAGESCIDLEGKSSSQGMVDGSDQPVSDDSFIVFEQPIVGKETNWKMSSNLESGVPRFADNNDCILRTGEASEHDNGFIVSDQSKSSNTQGVQEGATAVTDDTLAVQEHVDHEESPPGHEAGVMGAANLRKVSEREAKALAMQELLDKRKAASGNRSGKPNPLAEAQLRAEKLRAYKAGLQKNKQEKEEEEKKRIEDLRSQRKERIAARGSPVGTAASHSPFTRPVRRVSSLGSNKPSQTVNSPKLSSSSPPGSINAAAAALSPNVLKIKATGLKRPSRTAGRGSTKSNENLLSRSVPLISELKKESSKVAVRSSTGSQRLSQLKKGLKDADPNASPHANGHSEEKQRLSPITVIQKGMPPVKDVKGESLSVTKATKGSNVVTKQPKKSAISPEVQKPFPLKENALETGELVAPVEQTSVVNTAIVEALPSPQGNEGADDAGTQTGNIENNISNEISSILDDNHDIGLVQIRASASTELMEDIVTANDDSICPTDQSELEHVSADETLKAAEEPSNDVPPVCPASLRIETGDEKNTEEAYHAPVALESPIEDNSVHCQDTDDNKDAVSIPALTIPLVEDCNPPLAVPNLSPLETPSKDLPRLHEAMQQAHSPEFSPGVGTLRKKHSDSGSQKASKDHHAKGLKRLLLLGRKSHRSASQNPADGVTVAMTCDADDEGEDASSSIGKSGLGCSVAANMDGQADKLRRASNSGSSSGKGSMSFFSLSNFRGKSDGKS